MSAALVAATTSTPDTGLFAAVIVAAGVTALAALGMMLLSMHRSARLTTLRGLATAGLALGVVTTGSTYVVTPDDEPSIQLPTLPLD